MVRQRSAAEFLVLSSEKASAAESSAGGFCRAAKGAVKWKGSLVPPGSAADLELSAEQFFEAVKISAQEPALCCSRVFPVLEDIENRAIDDGQI